MLPQNNPQTDSETQATSTQSLVPAKVSTDKKDKKPKKPLTELTERELQRKLNIVWEQKAKVEAEKTNLEKQLAKIDKQLELLKVQEDELDNARHKVAQKKAPKK